MYVTYDPEVDALYISLAETTVTTYELGEGVALDLDQAGRLAGIEVLDMRQRPGGEDILRHLAFTTLGPAGSA